MNSEPIIVETIVNAQATVIWNALTDKEQMKKWYFDLEEFEATKGFKFQFYGGTEDRQYLHLCEVVEVVTGNKLSHTWMYESVPIETTVTWELFAKDDDQTTVRLTHHGVEKFPADNKDFARENFVQGWTQIVKLSLKNFVEGTA
jgi:uncharacterized protein YndB with AHSA1/START domain